MPIQTLWTPNGDQIEDLHSLSSPNTLSQTLHEGLAFWMAKHYACFRGGPSRVWHPEAPPEAIGPSENALDELPGSRALGPVDDDGDDA